MLISEILRNATSMSRIKRYNANWDDLYIIIDSIYSKLYLVNHSSSGVSLREYIPLWDDLIADDWGIMK
jgi:hypothetical protein